jgi:acyl-CoA synthetase (AMP-forming)/AMP-acid ligase II
VESVVTYLAALRGRHPVILVDDGRSDQLSELGRRFDPDVVIRSQGWHERRLTSRRDWHPELRLLLSTSGSTGSPKLVRLAAANLASNAAAIANYLQLTPRWTRAWTFWFVEALVTILVALALCWRSRPSGASHGTAPCCPH